jgi:predicted RNA binding protein YcfA (HicA-like mRNA interferase family)
MKHKEVVKRLRASGYSFSEGTNHTNVLNKDGKLITQIPRHHGKDLAAGTLAKIAKQTGVEMG